MAEENPLAVIRATQKRLHSSQHGDIHSPDDFAMSNCASCREPLASLEQVEALVKACLDAQESYELGSDDVVHEALRPFSPPTTDSEAPTP